jgi:hypothetical protein
MTGLSKHDAIKRARKMAQQSQESVFIIRDREYQQIYGDSFSFYPVRESKIDLLDSEADIVGLIEA